MDDDSLNMRNWGYYEPSVKAYLGLQLMSSMANRDTKPFLSGQDHNNNNNQNHNHNPVMVNGNGTFCEPPVDFDYMRDTWVNQQERFLHMLPGNSSLTHPMQNSPPPKDSGVRYEAVDLGITEEDKGTPTPPKAKRPKKSHVVPKDNGNGNGNGNGNANSSVQRAKVAKKTMDVVINGIDFDISSIPIPVCSCTGTPQQCYRWGCGGWQSACCTTTISMYPLPMSTKKRGARIAGRKMSQGAFKKVLEKLAAEDYNFSMSIDLRTYWAKHGTNKFVTIR